MANNGRKRAYEIAADLCRKCHKDAHDGPGSPLPDHTSYCTIVLDTLQRLGVTGRYRNACLSCKAYGYKEPTIAKMLG